MDRKFANYLYTKCFFGTLSPFICLVSLMAASTSLSFCLPLSFLVSLPALVGFLSSCVSLHFSPSLGVGVHRFSLPPWSDDFDSSSLLLRLGWRLFGSFVFIALIQCLSLYCRLFISCYLLLGVFVTTISSRSMVADPVSGLRWLHVIIFCKSSCLPE